MNLQAKGMKGREVPWLLHVVNLVALLVLGGILLLAAVVRAYELVFLLPVVLLGALYWRYRRRPRVAACYFGLSIAIGIWVGICEHIVLIDNVLGTQISTQLPLGFTLQAYLGERLNTASRRRLRETCCHDTLTYHFKPGSVHRETYDCETCNAPYAVEVDETGYLNRQRGLWQASRQIDLFVAGDSVLQGIGIPSVLEVVKDRLPLTMWNLSISGYGPRDKVNALLTYALPKQPRWLIIDFYSANDPTDALEDEACARFQDFRCKFSRPEIRRQLLQHPVYGALLDASPSTFGLFDFVTESSFTVAVTGYVIDNTKATLKRHVWVSASHALATSTAAQEPWRSADASHPGETNVLVRQGRLLEWVKAGMALTQQNYRRLVTTLPGPANGPAVILLYNPSAYEIYRDILLDRNPEYDEIAAFQVNALRRFADEHRWLFLDLTPPLRDEISASQAWIYGRYEGSHWSPQGTAVVADVLTRELARLVGVK